MANRVLGISCYFNSSHWYVYCSDISPIVDIIYLLTGLTYVEPDCTAVTPWVGHAGGLAWRYMSIGT